MKDFIEHQVGTELKVFLFYACLIWNGFGVLWGLVESVDQWEGHYSSSENRYIDKKTGCVYTSIVDFTNPGHILACEVLRKRFSMEGFGK